jgi:hypothetical protein
MKKAVWIFGLFMVMTTIIEASDLAATEPIAIGSRRELLIDDYLIDQKDDSLVLEMHCPVPREQVIVFDRPWEGNNCGYATVIQEKEDLYRLYYRAWSLDTKPGSLGWTKECICYAESTDGIQWTRPKLGLYEFEGNKENNIIWKGYGSHNFSPFKDANPNCKPEARYKALGGVGKKRGLMAFKSADGIRWSLLTEKPIITDGYFDSQNLAFWDTNRNSYVEYHRELRDRKKLTGRDIKKGTSTDFLNWAKPEWITFEPSRRTELYTNQIQTYYRAPHIYLGFPTRYVAGRGWFSETNERISSACKRCGTDYTDTGFITSRDGETFDVWPEAFIRPGATTEHWVYGFGFIGWGMAETKSNIPGAPNEISFYCSDVGHWFGNANSLRRYTLRLDGFVSASAAIDGGVFTTRPITFEGNRLTINFETSAAGSLQVEIQDADGKPIPGFKLEECPALFGNAVDYTVRWKNGDDVSALAGKPVRLRFVLKDADLYSFKFEKK